jgi:hypothetical protein
MHYVNVLVDLSLVIRKSYAAFRNFTTSLPNPNPDPNPMLSGQVESESESKPKKPARIRMTAFQNTFFNLNRIHTLPDN